jgi:hypothetical protein
MVVITQHRVGAHIQRKDLGQCQQLVFNPLAAVFKALASSLVAPAQKGAAHAAGNAVVVGGGIE